jgi:DNA repair protein RadC
MEMTPVPKFEAAEVVLSYKRKVPVKDMPRVQTSKDVAEIFRQCWDDGTLELREEAKVMMLDRNSNVLGVYSLSVGGVSGTVIDPKIVFVAALKAVASSIIIAHNHPSGSLEPSKSDIDLTERLRDAGDILDIALLDHFIITRDGYYSFEENTK